MKKYRKNVLLIGITFCTTLIFIVLFNIMVDPYDIFRGVIKKRPDDLKNISYLTKAVKIIQKKPDTLLLGTSTVDCGYAMRDSLSSFTNDQYTNYNPRLDKLVPSYLQPLNAGVNGGSLFEIYALLQHAYKNNPKLKHVIIGLEWHLFTNEVPPQPTTPDIDVFNKTYVPLKLYLKTTMTLQSTKDSVRVLFVNHKILKNIRNIFLKVPAGIDNLDTKIGALVAKAPATNELLPESVNLKIPNKLILGQSEVETYALAFSIHYISSLYSGFQKEGDAALLHPDAFDYLQRIVQFAKDKNIKLDIYISPQHATHWVTAEKFGLGSYVDRWLRGVAKITAYWDFSTALDFSEDIDNYFGGDDRHFNYAAGEIILSTIINGKADPKSGIVYVTNKNIDQVLDNRHKAQKRWLSHNKYLAAIFAYPKFSQMKKLNGEVEKIFVHYQPAYHGYDIFGFMDEFIAVPVEYAPYDLRRLMLGKYPHLIAGKTLGSLQKKIGLGMAPPNLLS